MGISSGKKPLVSRLRSRAAAVAVGLLAGLSSLSAASSVAIDNKPLTVTNSVPGNMVLLPSVEWPTVVTHANAPGVAEGSANYSGATAYAGYFNSSLCYAYQYDAVEANRYFYPVDTVGGSRSCSGKTGGTVSQRLWSGNFLNWSSMQAIDTFRLALTGGYRVHRPAEGAPSSVTITGSNGTSVTKSTSEMPATTYLEKANSDRFDIGYTPRRRLSSGASDSTPSQAPGIRMRIGGLRSQMWFIPNATGELGDAQEWNDPKALPLPVTDGNQSAPAGKTIAVIPYNPQFHKLPDSDTKTTDNSTPCATDEAGCSNPRRNTYSHTIYGKNQAYAVSVRVKVCDGTLDKRDICTQYGANYKPEGLLQRNAKKTRYSLFSYLSQSGADRDGGVMRARQKFLGPVVSGEKLYPDRVGRISGIDNPEWDQVTGVFINDPDNDDSSYTGSKIGNCNNAPDGSGCQIKYSGVINYLNRFGQINTGMKTLKAYDNLAEMYYTALRYMRGVGNQSAYSNLTGVALTRYQYADGLPVIEDWHGTGANVAVTRWNANPDNPRTVGTDRDPILYQCQSNVFLGIGDTATQEEQDTHSSDTVSNAVTWRSYTEMNSTKGNLGGLAYWAHLNDIRPDVPNTVLSKSPARARGQTTSTYWVDVVEKALLLESGTNQYYNATKYGGFSIPEANWGANGNASRPDADWFSNNKSSWTSATQNVGTVTGLSNGSFLLPNNMYLANNGQAMIDGLNSAFQKIADDISGSGGSFASNTTRLEAGARTYQAQYISNGWGGRLTASDVNAAAGELTPRWDASDWLGQGTGDPKINTNAVTLDYSQRKIFHRTGTNTLTKFISNWTGNVLTSPTLVKPSGLSALSDEQLKYLLGDRKRERQNGGALRNRRGMLGDIINSTPVYVGRPNANLYMDDPSYATFVASKASRKPVVYVGANDGMLHAFWAPDAGDTGNAKNAGKELFAFMPTEAMNILQQSNVSTNKYPYWDPEYDHFYSVDGDFTVADIKDGSTWKSILVGTMGRGGTAVFAMDVSDPDNPALLWESDANSPTVGPMMGNSLGRPIIARVADGDWRVFLGNGPNSSGASSALMMLDALTGSDDGSISVGTGKGLSPVNVWDGHGATTDSAPDGHFDTAYAGDMDGNLWKFDIAGGTSTKIFAAGDTQPITVAPLVAKNPYSPPDTWIFFGTGRYLSMADTSDAANQNLQSWYGIIDRNSLVSKSTLKESKILAQDSRGRVIEKIDAPGANGWYIDLKVVGAAGNGERMVVPNFFQGMTLIGTTRFPDSNDPCSPTGKGYTMAIDPFTGGRLGTPFFDMDHSGAVGDTGDYKDGDTNTPYSGIGYDSGPNNPIFLGSYMYTSLDDGGHAKTKTSAGKSTVRRVSWRELLNAN